MTLKTTALMAFLVFAARSLTAQVPTIDELVSLNDPQRGVVLEMDLG
jgi:hypothetical protein